MFACMQELAKPAQVYLATSLQALALRLLVPLVRQRQALAVGLELGPARR